ncbi:MAG TPA: DUF202 domain-containing protein [Verrucomicrobiae bacterium]|nr:DUF202 domain-containing protein [Verrucomicrobiae bacterium]
MNETPAPAVRIGPSDYLALERTFLAWIRTGLALMGFGFVVARFGLFLQMIQHAEVIHPPQKLGLSLWFGTALIVVGVTALGFSTWRYLKLVSAFQRGDDTFRQPLTSAVALAVILALVGLAMAIYVVTA